MIIKILKIAIFTIISILLSVKIAKSDEITDFFEKYSQIDDATYVNLTPNGELLDAAISMADKKVKDKEIKNILSGISNIRTLSLENSSKNTIEKIYNEALKIFSLKNYKKFLEVKEKGQYVLMLYKDEKSIVQEFVLISKENKDFNIIWINGKIDLKDLPKMQNMFKGSSEPSKGE